MTIISGEHIGGCNDKCSGGDHWLIGSLCTCPDDCDCDGSFCDNAPCVDR